MAKNYLYISAIGQLDNMACWAACLKWWYKAAKSITKSQRKIIDKYNYLTDEYGAMDESGIERLIELNKMKKRVFEQATKFTGNALWEYLKNGPVYVAFTETRYDSRHVNVIYDIFGTVANPQVWVMEPQARENPDLTYEGEHTIKPLSEFNRRGKVIIGA